MLRNPFMWIAVVIVLPVLAYAVYAEGWTLGLLPAFLGLALILSLQMRTRIESGELRVHLWPVWRRRQELSTVQRAWRIPYKWTAYGGWGLRWGQGATAYSVWGHEAVRLQLEGRDLVVETAQPEALLEALRAQGVQIGEP